MNSIVSLVSILMNVILLKLLLPNAVKEPALTLPAASVVLVTKAMSNLEQIHQQVGCPRFFENAFYIILNIACERARRIE